MIPTTPTRRSLPVTLALVVGLLVLGSSAQAGPSLPSPEQQASLESAEVVAPAVAADLARHGVARAELTLLLPTPEDRAYAGHPAWTTDVNPLLVDVVELATPGSIEMIERGSVTRLTADLPTAAVLSLADNPHVLAIVPGTGPAVPASVPEAGPTSPMTLAPKAHTTCTSNSSTACLLGDQFSVTAVWNGSTAFKGAESSQSVVFYGSNSANWEILAKVLNGCSINGHFWIFIGAATTQSYSVTVFDTDSHTTKVYTNPSCPVADTTAIDCPT